MDISVAGRKNSFAPFTTIASKKRGNVASSRYIGEPGIWVEIVQIRIWQAIVFLCLPLSAGAAGQGGSDVAKDERPCPGLSEGTKELLFSVDVSAALLSATQHQQTYGGDILLVRNWNLWPVACGWPHQRTQVELAPNYDEKKGKKPPANITQNYDGRIQHLFFLKNDRYFSLLDADLYHNNSLGIYFQQTYAAGLGGLFLNNHVELDSGLAVLGEHFYPPTASAKLIGTRLSQRISVPLKFIAGKPSLSETGIFIPVFNQSNSWQIRGVVTLAWILPNGLTVKIKSFNDYVRNAPSAFTRNYNKTTLSVGYVFSR